MSDDFINWFVPMCLYKETGHLYDMSDLEIKTRKDGEGNLEVVVSIINPHNNQGYKIISSMRVISHSEIITYLRDWREWKLNQIL